jgi:hypothetical protein
MPQVLGVFSQHPPLFGELSECPTYFLIKGAKRLLRAIGSALTAFFGSQIHPHCGVASLRLRSKRLP